MTEEKLPLNERDRLIEELGKSPLTNGMGTQHHNSIADFIINDRRRIVAPLVNVEKEIDALCKADTERRRYCQIFNKKRKEAIDATLRLAGLDKEKI